MKKLKQEKRRKLAANKILSVVCALSLVTSLIPTQVTYASGPEESAAQASQQEASEATDYYYLDTISGAGWGLKVNTADADMPAAGSLDDFMSWFGAANVTFSADEATDKAARAALSELYDVADDSAVSVGSFALPDGKAMPSDAKLTAWRFDCGASVPSSKLKAWAWDGQALAELDLTDDSTLAAFTDGGASASLSVEPGQTLVVADASKLSEKAQPKDYYYLDTISGAGWGLKVNTADADMPAAGSLDDFMSWFGAANVTFSADEATDKAARAALSELYDVADDSAVSVGSFALPDGKAMPSDAKLTAWRFDCGASVPSSKLKAWAWDGQALAELDLTDDSTLAAFTDGGASASLSVEPGQTLVVADASKLSEKANDALEAGTYTVTANLYIPGSENIVLPGVQVYMLCPTFAPTIPVSDNAKMVVDETGNKTISFVLNNGPSDVFTLQGIAGAPGETEVSNVQRTNEDLLYGTEASTNAKCYGRVGSFDVKLLNDSGDYSFTSCKEFPTPVSRYTTMPVRLSVDLSSARRSYVEPDNASDAISREFTDSATGFSAKVTTTEASVVAALKSEGTKLVVDSSTSGDAYKNAQNVLASLYNGELSFDFYSAGLVDASGNQVKLAGNTKVEIKLPTSKSDICDVALLQDGSVKTLYANEKATDGGFSLTREKLGTFAIIDKTKASKWESKTLVNGETGYSWTESYTDSASKNGNGATPGSTLSSIVRFDVSKVSDPDTLTDWRNCIDAAFADGAGKTNVTNAFGCFPRNFNLDQAVGGWWQGESLRTLSVPRFDGDGVTSDTKAFLITVVDGVTSAQLLAATVTDSSVDVTVFPSTLTSDEADTRLTRLFNGEGSKTNSAYDSYGKSYIVFASGTDAQQYERTFTGEGDAADVSYKVSTYRSDIATALKQAKANFSAYDSEADEASSIKGAFDTQLNINPTFRVFSVDVAGADGNSVALGSDEETELMLKSNYKSNYKSSRVYRWDGSILTLLAQGSDDSFTVKNAAMGTYVLVDANTARPKQYSFTFKDEETGIVASASTTYKPWAELLGAEGVSLKVTKADADSESYKQTAELLKQEYVQEVSFAIYAFDLVDKEDNSIDFGSGFKMALSLPANAGSSLYSLYEKDGSYSITSKRASTGEDGALQADDVILGSSLVLADTSNADKRQKYDRTFTAQVDGRDLTVRVKSSEPCMEKYLKDEGAATLEVKKIGSSDVFESAMKASACRVPEYVGYSVRLRGGDGSYAEPQYVGADGDSYTTITLSNLFGPETWSYNSALYGTSGTQQPFDLIQCASDGSVVWSGKRNGRASYDSQNAVDEKDGTKTFYGQWVRQVNLGGFEDCYLIDDQWGWLQWSDVEVPTEKELVYTGKEQSGYSMTYYRYGTDLQPTVEVVSGSIKATEVGEYTCTVRPALPFVKWAGCEGSDARAERTFTWKIVEAGDVGTLEQPIAEAQALLNATAVSADGADALSNEQWVSQADHDALASAIADAQVLASSTKAVSKTVVEDQASALASAVTAFKAAQKAGLKDAGTTYSVTANLSMPGEYNPVLSGVTVYANNPNNPFADKSGKSPVLDGGSTEGVKAEAPTTPMADNATILVAPDGTKTLVLDLPNPVFTLQDLGTCAELPNVKVETKEPADKSVWDYGKYDTRICRVTIELPEGSDSGQQQFAFKGSKLYAVPINADIQPDADKDALILDVDFSSVKTTDAVDRSALTSAVADAKKLAAGATVSVDGSDVSTEGAWVTKEALAAFNDAIVKASAVADANLVSKQMITDAADALQAAADAFRAAMKPGAKAELVKVAKPSAASGLVYTGSEQVGVAAAEGYMLTGAAATNAGSYTAVATLKAGYVWADGSADAVEIPWSIAKAVLTATYAGETVSAGTAPQLGVGVTGFVGGETAVSAAGYVAPTVSAPATLEAGKSYDLKPAGGKANNYTFTYVGGKLVVEAVSTGTLKPGEYIITANLSMPGDYNPVIPGATVYANNPNNPFADKAGNEPVLDGNSPVGVVSTTPTTPMTKNAKLVVAADGSKTLELDILNPVFTTQELGTCAELPNVTVTRKAPADASVWNYGECQTRISHISVPLTDDMMTGVKSYIFKGSKLYAVPLSMYIAPTGDVALELTVNYSSLPASALPDGVDPVPDPDPEPAPDPTPTPVDPTPDPVNPTPTPSDPDNSGSNTNPTPESSQPTTVATTTSGHFAAGTYTVSANLWFDKATTGLPLNPHMTNSGFPPSTPVDNNATMTVDASGHAWVSAPVVIQDKVMTINNVWGGAVSSFNGSTVVIDLGTPTADQTSFSGTCTSSVTIGWLARTIAAGIFNGVWDHTWSTNWEVDLVAGALPASGGGELPAEAQAILDGANGVAASGDAAAAALAAAENGAAKSSDAAKSGKAADGKSADSSKSGVAGAVEDLADAASSNPAVAMALGALCALVVAGAAGGVYVYRRKKRAAAVADTAGDAESK